MNNMKNKKFILTALLTLILSTALCFCALSADDPFESSIASFPESYKPYLRQLHEKYPTWVFVPFETELDWKTVIDNEYGTKNLVDNSASNNSLKSREPGHYNAAEDKFIYKDGGFVTANRLAVEYFMDPRNFLNEEGIFQFEQLTFSDAFTAEDVESVIKGTFMADKIITYYNAEGELVETDKKYSEVILEAGRQNNVNPCYLASKIRNEVGSEGSASVSGTHSVYPGIYNFYNIGATDGAGAITRGLAWANGGENGTATTYGRPWDTPEKSIVGGAKYITEGYIDRGQFTGYLQKFNVNKATGSLYLHQYMTNVTGALSQGYTSYTAYAKTGKLYEKYVFSIPVFNNMPSSDINTEFAANADSVAQTAEIATTSNCNVRTGPSTGNAKLTDASGNAVQLSKGASVKVISKTFTDSDYYANILKYPHWVKIGFTRDGKAYEGYVPESFVSYTSSTSVPTGTYKLTYHKGANTNLGIISSDSSVAKVKSDSEVKFLKKGTVYLTTYDSVGRVDVVKYTVTDSDPAVGTPEVTAYTETLKVTAGSSDKAKEYIYSVSDSKGNITSVNTTKTSYSFKNVANAEIFTVAMKIVTESGAHSQSTSVITATKPYAIEKAEMMYSGGGAEISWTKVSKCEGYLVYGYDSESKKYTKLAKISSEESKYEVVFEDLKYDSYCVRAYIKNGSKSVYGAYSDKVTPKSRLTVPEEFTVSGIKTDGYTLSWESVKDAKEYNVLTLKDGKWQKLATVKGTSYIISSLSPGAENAYKVAAVCGADVSDYTKEIYAMTSPETVKGLKAENITSSQAKLSWNKAGGADLYNLYLYEDGEYKLYDEYTAVSCSFESLSQFTQYKFKVAAVAKSDNNTIVGALSDEISVVTLPEKAEDLRAATIKDDEVTLKWAENKKASGYIVYVYDREKKDYVKAAESEKNEATVKSLTMATKYKFAVSCYGEIYGEVYHSELSDTVNVTTAYGVPKDFTLSSVKATSYKLIWAKISGAASYNVYRKNGSSYEKILSTKNNYYSVSGLTYGDVAYYKVSAVYKVGKKTVESSLSAEVGATTLPDKVRNFTASPSTTSVTLKWDEVKNADCYNVYIYEDGKYDLQKTVTGTSYKLTGLRQGATYKFTVRAYIKLSTGTRKGSMASVTATLKPAKVSKITLSSVTDKTQKLSWPAAVGANYYYIYRYDSASKKYVQVAKTADRSYTFKNLTAGKTYAYKIMSAVLKDSKVLSKGSYSSVYKFSTDPAKVTGLKSTSATSSKVALSWNKVSGATYYEISYYSGENGSYILAGTSEKNSFTVTGLSKKTQYKFKVRAIRTVNDKDYTGYNSSVISVKTK
ncbi:MAG: fibronectin type III domain-containing protein [Clostridia bacterium]|nr:fibronectin type III domain-containing protein [Clostridia bacterium]